MKRTDAATLAEVVIACHDKTRYADAICLECPINGDGDRTCVPGCRERRYQLALRVRDEQQKREAT